MRDEFLIEYRDHYITCFYTYDNLRRYAVIFKDKITLTLIEAQAIIDEHIAKQEANS